MKNLNRILPTEIISDILSRLPAKSVLECKSVCKSWKIFIQNRSFPQMHLTRLSHDHNPDPTDSGKLRYVFFNSHRTNHVWYFESDDSEDWNSKPISKMTKIDVPLDDYIVIGSINGLICIYGYDKPDPDPDAEPESEIHGPACIINPVTKEYILLPEFDDCPEYDTKGFESVFYEHLACGFGYAAETNEYKVFRMYCEFPVSCKAGESNVLEVEVYTVGSGKGWRHVGKFDFGFRFFPHWDQTHGVFLNGCLRMLLVFDLADEKFRDHISPPAFLMETVDDEDETDSDEDDVENPPVIGVSGGGILYYAVCQSGAGRRPVSEVWLLMRKEDNLVMKGHEEHQSLGWVRVDSLDQKEPFAFTELGTVLRYDQGTIKMLTAATWQVLLATSFICRQIFPHRHTLISMKDLGEENAQIMGIDFKDTESSK